MRPVKQFIVAAGLTLAGCTVGPNYRAPRVQVPDRYTAASTQPSTTPAATQPINASAAWWTTFNDPALDRLIDEARRSNLDLRTAEARVREARAARGVVAADRLPTVDASGSYSRSRSSQNAGMFPGVAGIPTEQDLWTAGFDAAWEIDVFGGVRRLVEAANADIAAAVADRNDVLLTLLGEVARNYVELRGFQRQVAIAADNARAQRETLDLTRVRLNAGLGTDLEVARAEAQVAATESQVPTFQTRAAQAMHRLAVLSGKAPAALTGELAEIKDIPAPPPAIPAGVPSELLRRRPDIRRAERELAAATARVGVATADLFPRFRLTGSAGLQSNAFSSLGDSASSFWSIGPGVSLPIFNAGSVRAGIRVQNARTDAALARYEQTVLRSLEEVENALVAYRQEFSRRALLAQAVASSQRSVQLSQQLFQRGLTDFLNVLDAQQALYQNQDLLVQSDANVSANAVALFKALGGGWAAPAAAPAPAPAPAGAGEMTNDETRNPKE
jgi:NodT family efflux transporter outer membrane factor (OMF) lipoprotein